MYQRAKFILGCKVQVHNQTSNNMFISLENKKNKFITIYIRFILEHEQ